MGQDHDRVPRAIHIHSLKFRTFWDPEKVRLHKLAIKLSAHVEQK